MNFLKTYHLAITPLSPIHIGCGEDFEPTNYVIDADKERLYGFDPGSTVLPEELAQKLTKLAESANLLGIQRFDMKRFMASCEIPTPSPLATAQMRACVSGVSGSFGSGGLLPVEAIHAWVTSFCATIVVAAPRRPA